MPRVIPTEPLDQRIQTILETWTNADEIRLRAGEISPVVMRDILAVTNGMRRCIEAELKAEREKV